MTTFARVYRLYGGSIEQMTHSGPWQKNTDAARLFKSGTLE